MGAFTPDTGSSWPTAEQRNMHYMCPLAEKYNVDRILRQFNQTTGALEGQVVTQEVSDYSVVGSSANTAGSGIALSVDVTGALQVFADDAGASLDAADNVRCIQGRLLLTTNQSGCTIRAIQGQLKMATGKALTSGVFTANQGYVELMGTLTVASAAHFSCMDASLELGGVMTVSSGGFAYGVHVETTGAGTIVNNGTCAAVGIAKASGAASWPVGLNIEDSVTTTGIAIGTTTTAGITIGATATGISIAGACSGDGIKISGICADGIEISGAATTTGLNVSGNCVTGITIAAQTTAGITIGATVTGISLTGAVTTGINIAGNATDGVKISGGTVVDAIEIGACTYGVNVSGATTDAIRIAGDATYGIDITSGCSPTTGFLMAGAGAYAIDVTGVQTTMVMRANSQTKPLYQGGTTITLSGANVNAYEINATSAANAAYTLTGLAVTTIPSTADQATSS
ncbi:MAG TPA: hypothetical protein VM243_08685, partial [Phycisphaerae bacterium]|nr:hypothetical protein [Phycisphaerae bacterium]